MEEFKFCSACEEVVRNNGWKICRECHNRLRDYEKEHNCIMDIGMQGEQGESGCPGTDYEV